MDKVGRYVVAGIVVFLVVSILALGGLVALAVTWSPTELEAINRRRAFEIYKKFNAAGASISRISTIAGFGDRTFYIVDRYANTVNVIVSKVSEEALEDWKRCSEGDHVSFEVRKFHIPLPTETPAEYYELGYFLKPTCTRPSVRVR